MPGESTQPSLSEKNQSRPIQNWLVLSSQDSRVQSLRCHRILESQTSQGFRVQSFRHLRIERMSSPGEGELFRMGASSSREGEHLHLLDVFTKEASVFIMGSVFGWVVAG